MTMHSRSIFRQHPLRKASTGQGIFEIISAALVFSLITVVMASVSLYLLVEHAAVSAAREGARLASLSQDVNADKSTIISRVKAVVLASCGQHITDSSINITPPDPAGKQGSRTVVVSVNYDLPTPLNAGGLLTSFQPADPNHPPIRGAGSTVPIVAKATMHYEE